MKIQKITAFFLTLVLLLGILAGCGKTATSDLSFDQNGAALGEGIYDSPKAEDSSASAGDTVLSDRKLIKTADIDAETEDLDRLLSELSAQIGRVGGYVESQEIYNGSAYSSGRSCSASITIRIPAEELDNFVNAVAGFSNVISRQTRVEDVTLTYVATESRVAALQAEEARLLELMAQAETMSDLLEIESRLTDVRYELESVTSQLRVLENQVSYSTVSLYVSEVRQYTVVAEESLWQRISGGFVRSLKNLGNGILELLVFLLVNLPYLVVVGLVVAVIVILIVRRNKKIVAKRAKQPDGTGEKPEENP